MPQSSKMYTFFKNNYPFNHEGLEEFLGAFESKRVKKGSILRKARHIEKELCFLEEGLVREYYATPEKEVNIHFFTKATFITDLSSLYGESPTQKWQECLSDVQLRVLAKSTFHKLLDKYPCGRTIMESLFQKIVEAQDQREFERITKKPEELYKDLLQQQARLLHLIPQYHIASYLGVTPETLSRIRKRIS